MSTAVETEIKTHEFYARGRHEKLVRQPAAEMHTALGAKVPVQASVFYDFAPDGHLTVREGQDLLPDGPIDPATGERSMQDAVAWLSSHPLLNTRFWHDGHEPDRPLPTEDDFLAIVTDAAAALQREPIVVALEQERASHNRPVLVKTAERALARVDELIAKYKAEHGDGEPPTA
jgi:hypothetical protein